QDDPAAANLSRIPLTDEKSHTIAAFLFVRGNGSDDPKKAIQIRRRYMLIGETLDSMRVWDVARGVDLLRSEPAFQKLPLQMAARGANAANLVLYALMTDSLPASLSLLDL